MTFSNGYRGVKKVFTAELLALISAVLILVAGVAFIVSLAAAAASEEAALVVGGGAGIFSLIAGILIIIALILKLLGLYQAGMDDESFKTAFVIAISALTLQVIAVILNAIFGSGSMADDVVQLIQRLANIAIIFFVIGGIQNFAARLNHEKMLNRGNKIAWVIAIPYVLSAIAGLIPGFFGVNVTTGSISGIMLIISGILSIIGSILYLIYLGQAKKMLRDN